MMASAGGATRATGRRATAIRFQQFGEGGVAGVLSLRHFRLASWCSLSLGGWWPSHPAPRISTRSGRLGGASPPAPFSF